MTAKVIETGEIIEVKRLPHGKYSRLVGDGEIVVEYDEDELDFGENYSGPLTCRKILNIRRKSYKQGKDDLLNKAVEWLVDNSHLYCNSIGGMMYYNVVDLIHNFKKAMEE